MNIVKHLTAILVLTTSSAWADPGAHGPNGEHLDSPASHVHSETGPRLEAFTGKFELVGRLEDSELSVLIDRYDSNEPVLNGKVEVETAGIKAPARFHADHGDYAVDNARLLEALAKPGKHRLVFTVSAGSESDLMEAVLEVGNQSSASHGHHFPWAAASLIGAIVLFAIGAWYFLGRRHWRNAR
jgi:hypothetical protein